MFCKESALEQEVSIIIGRTSTRLLAVSQESYYLCQRWSKEGRGWEITRESNLGDSFAKSVCGGGQWRKSRVENAIELK